jgi:hypothetical protein
LEIAVDVLQAVWREWSETVNVWKKGRFAEAAEHLSYSKTFAILLHTASKKDLPFVHQQIKEILPKGGFKSLVEDEEVAREEIVRDVLAAPEIVTTLDFVLSAMNFFEKNRVDRHTPFSFRLTETIRHDMIVELHRGEMTAEAIFIAFECLYARH